ncbi:MAG: heavy metal-responsive transcriptional regulator [Polyangiaceae bacterium]|jgi:MerR family mercuric resistance operon transcriptional regulator|nr:heavy metal-responsive transcriptional regulator [Polyangiaceae bacterium]
MQQQRTGLTIGQLARRCGVGVETIRFYEREGLLEQPRRPGHGYRRYPESDIERVLFLQRAKGLGFSLKEITELLALREKKSADCASIRERAASKVAMIKARIASLEALREELELLVAACDGRGPLQDCRILRALSSGDPTPTHPKDSP